ncbi:unnamed protein product [Miscanthus lutarioriparius]|uniref:Uncharacterized protein n=1 Tax=Miscanthus lutarioriparius TaxID=422564 RepID=A0A811QMS7_9POAL|nr:unnamed protein product [Miscanthus lutarioriparius]
MLFVALACGRPCKSSGGGLAGVWCRVIRELDSMKQREGTVNKGDHHPAMDRGVHGNGELVDPCPELGRHVPGRTNPARDPFGAAHRRGDRDRLRSDEKVVVLSNSVTLRSKPWQRYGTTTVNHHHLHSVIQMTNVCSLSLLGIGTETAWLHAQGLPCEGAKEFRESLMDPSSRRFMWAASTAGVGVVMPGRVRAGGELLQQPPPPPRDEADGGPGEARPGRQGPEPKKK